MSSVTKLMNHENECKQKFEARKLKKLKRKPSAYAEHLSEKFKMAKEGLTDNPKAITEYEMKRFKSILSITKEKEREEAIKRLGRTGRKRYRTYIDTIVIPNINKETKGES